MYKNDEKMLEKIVQTRRAVKEKFNQLRSGRVEAEEALERSYKPLTKTLSEFASTKIKREEDEVKREPSVSEIDAPLELNNDVFNTTLAEKIDNLSFIQYLDKYTDLPRKYISGLIRDTKMKKKDKVYDTGALGVRLDAHNDTYMIGDSEIAFDGNDLLLQTERYTGTPGLYELLFKITPSEYTDEDEAEYKKIIELTNAHRQRYNPLLPYAASRSDKYNNVIKPLFGIGMANTPKRPRIASAPTFGTARDRIGLKKNVGEGHFDSTMSVENEPYQYVYWDDPNELIDRLCLLLASKRAGNGSHTNEIARIEEELREANIIW